MHLQRHSLYIIAFLLGLIAPDILLAYEQELNMLSTKLAEDISSAQKGTIAVVDFTDLQGNVTELGRFLAEEFSVALAGSGKGFEVVDRTHLRVILQENKLSSTGLIDPTTAKKLGQITGVEAIITGTITPFGDTVRVAVKILDSSTAKVIGSVRGNIAKTRAIQELLEAGISTARETASHRKPRPQPNVQTDQSALTVAGNWTGEWSGAGGDVYSLLMELEVSEDTIVNGRIEWTYKISGPSSRNISKVGMSGTELVRGSYDSRNRRLLLEGYDELDPNNVIGKGSYDLKLTKDGNELNSSGPSKFNAVRQE